MKVLLFIYLSALYLTPLFSQEKDWHHTIFDLLNSGRYEQAVNELNRRIAVDGENAEILYYLGQAFQQMDRHEEALAYLERIQDFKGNEIMLQFALSKSYEALGIFPAAIKTLQTILQFNPANHKAGWKLAEIYMKQDDYDKADSLYKDLVKTDMTNPILYKNLGLCAIKTNQIEAGIGYFIKALSFNNRDMVVYINLHNAYHKLKKYEQGELICIQAIKLFPRSRLLYRALGENQFSLEKYSEAYSTYSNLMTLGDSSKTVYKRLGFCAYQLKDYPLVLYALKKSIDSEDPDPLVYLYLGLTFKHLNNENKAIELLEKAIKLSLPEYLDNVYLQLAESYDQIKDYSAALTVYKQANSLYPEWSLPLFYIALIYDRYYADRKPCLEYYRMFIERAVKDYQQYVAYAEERIIKIKEEQHFKTKKE